MKYQKGTLEYVAPFEATTEQILAAIAEGEAEDVRLFQPAGDGYKNYLADHAETDRFKNQVNFCMAYLAMFTRQASCSSELRKHDAEKLAGFHIPKVALLVAIVLIQFPRAAEQYGYSYGLPAAEAKWIFDTAQGTPAAYRRWQKQPRGWHDFVEAKSRFTR